MRRRAARRRLPRGWMAPAAGVLAGLCLSGSVIAATAAGAQPAPAAAPTPAASAAPATTTAPDGRTLSVDPATAVPASDATVTVSGTGFNTGSGLYVAVCMSAPTEPGQLNDCIGGPVPGQNATDAWADVTSGGTAPTGGGVGAAWGPNGSFSVQLTLPSAVGDNVNCLTGQCQVYARSGKDRDTSSDMAVPIAFAVPASDPTTPATTATTPAPATPTTPAPTTAPPTTAPPTTAAPPSTVKPDSIQAPSVQLGERQVIKFSGFKPGESVAVTLYSDPISLPEQIADSTGSVTVTFQVPDSLSPGTHTLQVRGLTSGTVGIASFQVVPVPVTTTASPTPTTTTSETPATTTVSPATATSEPLTTASAAGTTSELAPVATGGTAAPPRQSTAQRFWWLWLIIAVLVILAVIAVIVAVRRRNALARENELAERTLQQAALEEQARDPRFGQQPGPDAPTAPLHPPGSPPDPRLLRDDPDNPVLFSHRAAEEREVAEHQQNVAQQRDNPPAAPGDVGPSTSAWTPDFGDDDARGGPAPGDASPSTSAWTPDFGDDEGDGGSTGGNRRDGR